MFLDRRQLASKRAVDHARGEAVEPGKDSFRKTDLQFDGIADECTHDLARNVVCFVARTVQGAVQRVDRSLFIGVRMARGEI